MKLINRLKKSTYIKNIATLGFGTIIAQIILIGITPIITRIYTPEEIGVYTFILGIITMISPIVNGRYEISIVVANDDFEANTIAVACLIMQVITVSLVGIILLVSMLLNAAYLDTVGPLVFIALPIITLIGTTNVLSSYNNRFKQYRLIASVGIIRAVAQSSGQLTFGFLQFGSIGLLISQLLSSLLGLGRQSKYAITNIKDFLKIKFKDVLMVLKKYKNQPIYSAPAMLINSASYSILIFYITNLYGMKELGYYFISYRMLGIPIQLITMNVSKVYFARAAEEHRLTGTYKNSFKKTLLLLFAASVPIFTIIALIAPNVFELVFGEGWNRAGVFVAILAPMFATRFVVSSLSLSLAISNKQKYEIILQVGFIISATISYTLSNLLSLSIIDFLILISGLYTINYLFVLVMLYFFSKKVSNEKK